MRRPRAANRAAVGGHWPETLPRDVGLGQTLPAIDLSAVPDLHDLDRPPPVVYRVNDPIP